MQPDAEPDCDRDCISVWQPIAVAHAKRYGEPVSGADSVIHCDTVTDSERDAEPQRHAELEPDVISDGQSICQSDADAEPVDERLSDGKFESVADGERYAVAESSGYTDPVTDSVAITDRYGESYRLSQPNAYTYDVYDAVSNRDSDADPHYLAYP
jgi:hypothetical protein